MARDPYHDVQRELQGGLQAADALRASYVRIRGMAREGSEELVWARNELKATLAALEADLEDLEESVKIVESTDARMFGLDDVEVRERRRYVSHVRREIENMRAEVNGTAPLHAPLSPRPPPSPQVRSPKPGTGPGSPSQEEPDDQSAWAREEQQMMIREQDSALDSIAGTLSTIAQQAGLMGHEIGEHNEMLDDLERGVDHTDNKLSGAMRRMRKFIRDTEETKSGWCIVILMIILVALLLAVILT